MTTDFSSIEQGWLDQRDQGGLRHRTLTWNASGDGPLVLFIHAASLCAGAWAPVVSRLGGGIRAVAYDQRGHGDTDAPSGSAAYSWELFGDDFGRVVEAVTQSHGRAPDLCVTHSFAGDCALVHLAKRSAPLGKLILLDPVLADAEGATVGAQRLAKGTRRLGEKEAEGFESKAAVGEGLERVLRAQLERAGLDPASKAAFAEFGSALDESGRYRLKCERENEAEVYVNRVAIADYLADKSIDADVQLVFSSRRRAKPEDQAAAYARDWEVAQRVVQPCREGAVHRLDGVGHFLVLEAPDLVAETIARWL